jgi:hypothetical protein
MKLPGPSRSLGLLATAAIVACSACSATRTTPTGTTNLGRQVQTIIASTDAALRQDQQATPLAISYQSYSADFTRAAARFRALAFPASMQADVDALVTALDTLATDAATTARAASKNQQITGNVRAEASAALAFTNEIAAEKSASAAVRRDVGLLAATTTTASG